MLTNDAEAFLAYHEIMGVRATIQDIVQLLSRHTQADVIFFLCNIGRVLAHPDGLKGDTQFSWAKELLRTPVLDGLRRCYSQKELRGRPFLIGRSHRLALQIAALACKGTEGISQGEKAKEVFGDVIEACAMATDVVDDMDALYDTDLDESNAQQWCVTAIVPLVGSDHQCIDFEIAGRATYLWQDIVQSDSITKALGKLKVGPVEEAFKNRHGFSLTDFTNIMVVSYVRLLVNCLRLHEPLMRIRHTDAEFKQFGEDKALKALRLFSQSPARFALDSMRSRHSWVLECFPLQRYPLIEFPDGGFCCPSIHFLLNSLVEAPYQLLEEMYGKATFKTVFGHIFEEYLKKLFYEFAITESPLATYLHGPTFKGSTDQASDGVLIRPTLTVLMEFKAGLLTRYQRYGGNADDLIDGILTLAVGKADRKAKKGLKQLASSIERLKRSPVITAVVDHPVAVNQLILPALVLFDESPVWHCTRRLLQDRFDQECDAIQLDRDNVGPLLLLSPKDIETIASISQGSDLEKVFLQYALHVQAHEDALGTFSAFVDTAFPGAVKLSDAITIKRHHQSIRAIFNFHNSVAAAEDS